jgi:branched-chain amino acid transport system substrate-binding protein
MAMAAGCLGGGGDEDSGTITIGLMVPLPGEFPAGTSMRNTSQIFVDNLNNNGGLLDRDVELIVRDTELDPTRTRDQYRSLMLEEEVDISAGTYAASAATPIFEEINDFEKIHVTGGAAQMNIPEEIGNNYDEKKYWFSTTNGAMLGLSTIDFFNTYYEDLGWTNIAIAGEDIQGFDPIIDRFTNNLDDGVNLQFTQRFSSDTSDFNPLLDSAEDNDVDCLVAFVSQGGSSLVLQWANQERPFHLGGGEVFSSNPARWEQTNGRVQHLWTYVGGSGPGYEANDVTSDLIQKHQDEHGAPPPHQQGYAQWDVLKSWVEGVREAGTLDEDEVIQAMEENVLEVSTGTLEYHGQDGRWPHDPVYGSDRIQYPIIQWQEGGDNDLPGDQVGLHPEKSRNGEYVPPSWL